MAAAAALRCKSRCASARFFRAAGVKSDSVRLLLDAAAVNDSQAGRREAACAAAAAPSSNSESPEGRLRRALSIPFAAPACCRGGHTLE